MGQAASDAGALVPRDRDVAPDDEPLVDPQAQIDASLEALEASRLQVERGLLTLRDEADRYVSHARTQLDWRRWVRERPWRCVAVSFGIGLYLGMR